MFGSQITTVQTRMLTTIGIPGYAERSAGVIMDMLNVKKPDKELVCWLTKNTTTLSKIRERLTKDPVKLAKFDALVEDVCKTVRSNVDPNKDYIDGLISQLFIETQEYDVVRVMQDAKRGCVWTTFHIQECALIASYYGKGHILEKLISIGAADIDRMLWWACLGKQKETFEALLPRATPDALDTILGFCDDGEMLAWLVSKHWKRSNEHGLVLAYVSNNHRLAIIFIERGATNASDIMDKAFLEDGMTPFYHHMARSIVAKRLSDKFRKERTVLSDEEITDENDNE